MTVHPACLFCHRSKTERNGPCPSGRPRCFYRRLADPIKIIFLDIDGVMNCSTTLTRMDGNIIGIDPIRVEILNALLRATGAKIVLSSTWRLFDNWHVLMQDALIEGEFIGCTPYRPRGGGSESMERGYEIQEWLETHKDLLNVEKYAIIDDDSDMLPGQPLFKTSYFHGGLTVAVANEVANYLNS